MSPSPTPPAAATPLPTVSEGVGLASLGRCFAHGWAGLCPAAGVRGSS